MGEVLRRLVPPAVEKKSVLKPAAAEPAKDGAADPAKGDPAKATEGASDEPYEVKVPEGVKVDEAKLKTFTGWAKEKGLSAAQATEALAFYAKQQGGEREAWAKQGDDWYGQLEKDPEFGGANLKESEAALQKGLKRFDPKGELVADLERYGIENLPSLAKLLRRIGLASAEDKGSVDTSKGSEKKPSSEEARLAKRYPSIKGIQAQ